MRSTEQRTREILRARVCNKVSGRDWFCAESGSTLDCGFSGQFLEELRKVIHKMGLTCYNSVMCINCLIYLCRKLATFYAGN